MALEAIPQALWFFLPAFVANPMAVVFGGGTPIDFGRTLRDRERLFGDGKTWRGGVGGAVLGGVLGVVFDPAVHPFPPRFPRGVGVVGGGVRGSPVPALRAPPRGLPW